MNFIFTKNRRYHHRLNRFAGVGWFYIAPVLTDNDLTGIFTPLGTVFGNAGVFSINCGDIDVDGDNDVIIGKLEGTGGNKLYFNK